MCYISGDNREESQGGFKQGGDETVEEPAGGRRVCQDCGHEIETECRAGAGRRPAAAGRCHQEQGGGWYLSPSAIDAVTVLSVVDRGEVFSSEPREGGAEQPGDGERGGPAGRDEEVQGECGGGQHGPDHDTGPGVHHIVAGSREE